MMFDSTKLEIFFVAALLLAVAPGPGMLYVLARSLAGGKREGVLSATGTFLGGMVHVLAAALGVSVILARSALAFSTVKYLGAAYLCFLGVRMILEARRADTAPSNDLPTTGNRTQSTMAGRRDGVSQSQDSAIFSFLHSAVRNSWGWTCFFSIRSPGNCFGGSQYLR
jgi:threonine/homoserine/homoserine lactone efflux protein